ncbi:MAG: thioredoxin family protein [Arcobacteraceae bacterium]
MKKILFLFLISVTVLFSAELNYIKTFDEAKDIAKKQEKQILVMFTMDGCPACEYMKDVAFANETLKAYLQNYFVIYEVDYNKKETYPQGLNPFGTPTFYVLDNEWNKKGRAIVGGATADVFLNKLKEFK